MIVVELGNNAPVGWQSPAVTRWVDASGELNVEQAFSAITGELIDGSCAPDCNMPHDHGPRHFFIGGGAWASESNSHNAAWVDGNNPELNQRLADYYGCPVGAPSDVEDTHYTFHGPPGVGPKPPADAEAETAKGKK